MPFEYMKLIFLGNIVSARGSGMGVSDNTIGELTTFIQHMFPRFSGFTRIGLYRMKQFYELYSSA